MKVKIYLAMVLLFISTNIFSQVDGALDTFIYVNGACGMCKDRIENAAMNIQEVDDAYWDAKEKKLYFTILDYYFDIKTVHKAVAKVGHDTDIFKADNDVYNALPSCCHYRKEDSIDVFYKGAKKFVISGVVYERDESGDLKPLEGASLVWLNTTNGAMSDSDGKFQLEGNTDNTDLVISFVGYDTDTLEIEYGGDRDLEIILSNSNFLDEIEIVYRKKTTEISKIGSIKVHQIGEGELQKAACCNLSESFQTTPSVDVGFTDAVTGIRKIEMLGLSGKYVQITRESMPYIRGLSSIYGLTYIPGHWIEGIQFNMGVGSVVNGFESMTGQINVELRKPENSDPIFLNFYGNKAGNMEANMSVSHKITDKISTSLLVHGNVKNTKIDNNDDNFLDSPVGNRIIAVNRWKFASDKSFKVQIGIKGLSSDKISGQADYDNYTGDKKPWVAQLRTNRLEVWAKSGRIFKHNPNSSLGFQASAILQNQENTYGKKLFEAKERSFYGNMIYQNIISNTKHKYKLGLSYQLDYVDEFIDADEFAREEHVPGAFLEYSFIPNQNLTLVGGIRGDLHNNYGFFVSPRINFRYAFTPNTIFRLAAGKGHRTASVFAENIGFLASSRQFKIMGSKENDNPYGLNQEKVWNFGANLIQIFDVFDNDLTITLDAYHTRFEDQVVVDIENPREVRFYNLQGKSFSNSLQAQIDYTILESLDFRLAFRMNDVKTDYTEGFLEKPLSSKYRAFLNVAYSTENDWKFDATVNWQGKKRIANTSMNPEQYQLAEYSPDFYILSAQVSKSWSDIFEIYLGVDNILNYTQPNPILSYESPFSEYFDAGLIWGPVLGRNIYFGLRYKIPESKK